MLAYLGVIQNELKIATTVMKTYSS